MNERKSKDNDAISDLEMLQNEIQKKWDLDTSIIEDICFSICT